MKSKDIIISPEMKKVFEENKNNFKLKDFKYDIERVSRVQCCGDYCTNATPFCKIENCENYAIFDTETEDEAAYNEDGNFVGLTNNGLWICQEHLIQWEFLENRSGYINENK